MVGLSLASGWRSGVEILLIHSVWNRMNVERRGKSRGPVALPARSSPPLRKPARKRIVHIPEAGWLLCGRRKNTGRERNSHIAATYPNQRPPDPPPPESPAPPGFPRTGPWRSNTQKCDRSDWSTRALRTSVCRVAREKVRNRERRRGGQESAGPAIEPLPEQSERS